MTTPTHSDNLPKIPLSRLRREMNQHMRKSIVMVITQNGIPKAVWAPKGTDAFDGVEAIHSRPDSLEPELALKKKAPTP